MSSSASTPNDGMSLILYPMKNADGSSDCPPVRWVGLTPLEMIEEIASMVEAKMNLSDDTRNRSATQQRPLRVDTSFLAAKSPDLPPLPPPGVRRNYMPPAQKQDRALSNESFDRGAANTPAASSSTGHQSGLKRSRSFYDSDGQEADHDDEVSAITSAFYENRDIHDDDVLNAAASIASSVTASSYAAASASATLARIPWDPSYIIHHDPDPRIARGYADELAFLARRLEALPTCGRCLPSYKRVQDHLAQTCERISLRYYNVASACTSASADFYHSYHQRSHRNGHQHYQHYQHHYHHYAASYDAPDTLSCVRPELDGLYRETILKMEALIDMASAMAQKREARHGYDATSCTVGEGRRDAGFSFGGGGVCGGIGGGGPAFQALPASVGGGGGRAKKTTVAAKKTYNKRAFGEYMNTWLRDNWTNPYPDDEGMAEIAKACGTTASVANNWLINARTRKWRPAIVKAYEMGRPARLLWEDSVNIFSGKPVREIEGLRIISTAPLASKKRGGK